MILLLAAISIIDGRKIIKMKLRKELYAYVTFAVVIIVYGFLYFSNRFNASIADALNKLLIQK